MKNKDLVKKKELTVLFQEAFDFDFFTEKRTNCNFHCNKVSECNVKEGSPKYTGIIGDLNTKIMVVGEAPSLSRGKGPFCAGFIESMYTDKENKANPFFAFIDFVRTNFHETPYFTDIMKCGFSSEESRSVLNKKRTNICKHKFLIREIEIINPKMVFCLGDKSYQGVKDLLTEKRLLSKIKIYKFLHYGRQANLPLSINEKKEIIWKYQANLLTVSELKEKMGNLKYFSQNQ